MRLHLHRWETVRSHASHRYESCTRCPARRVVHLVVGGYYPVDVHWVETGEFRQSRPPVSVPSASSRPLPAAPSATDSRSSS